MAFVMLASSSNGASVRDMGRVYVGVGSNINRGANIRSAVKALRKAFGDLLVSTVYETESVGFEGDDFYNLVIGFDTDLSVHEVSARLHDIENQHGRNRGSGHMSSRTLDLDLLLYDDVIMHEAGVQIPRGDITKYAFVLKPLSEIAGDRVHPETGQRFSELWAGYSGPTGKMRPVEPRNL